MSVIDRLYYQRRAEIELDMAQRSTTPVVASAHYRLLDRYLDLLYAPGAQEGTGRETARA